MLSENIYYKILTISNKFATKKEYTNGFSFYGDSYANVFSVCGLPFYGVFVYDHSACNHLLLMFNYWLPPMELLT